MDENKKNNQHQLGKLGSGAKTSINNEYYTPINIIKYVMKDNNIDKIDIDVATNEFNKERLSSIILDGFTKEDNGLAKDWTQFKTVWINPPFSNKAKWIEKVVESINCDNSKIEHLFFLTPDKSLTNKSMTPLLNVEGVDIYFPSGRISFLDNDGNKTKGAAFGSVIIHYKRDRKSKIKTFEF